MVVVISDTNGSNYDIACGESPIGGREGETENERENMSKYLKGHKYENNISQISAISRIRSNVYFIYTCMIYETIKQSSTSHFVPVLPRTTWHWTNPVTSQVTHTGSV
jgi:hypothetical protein